mmetsp:Transcript_65012/g.89344  ORF Transcript_65012/g.89344 Transcript_65012/m.89344 type:complete len:225 (-) Transcript_65012:444-1118(-)
MTAPRRQTTILATSGASSAADWLSWGNIDELIPVIPWGSCIPPEMLPSIGWWEPVRCALRWPAACLGCTWLGDVTGRKARVASWSTTVIGWRIARTHRRVLGISPWWLGSDPSIATSTRQAGLTASRHNCASPACGSPAPSSSPSRTPSCDVVTLFPDSSTFVTAPVRASTTCNSRRPAAPSDVTATPERRARVLSLTTTAPSEERGMVANRTRCSRWPSRHST